MPMIFTHRAAEALRRLLNETEHGPGEITRMVTDIEGHHHLTLDSRKDTDQVVEHDGEVVLIIDRRVSDHMVEHHPGKVMDVVETPDGPQLTIADEGTP